MLSVSAIASVIGRSVSARLLCARRAMLTTTSEGELAMTSREEIMVGVAAAIVLAAIVLAGAI